MKEKRNKRTSSQYLLKIVVNSMINENYNIKRMCYKFSGYNSKIHTVTIQYLL